MTLTSVLLPVYNGEKYLDQVKRSLHPRRQLQAGTAPPA